jgi:hypothetical protein
MTIGIALVIIVVLVVVLDVLLLVVVILVAIIVGSLLLLSLRPLRLLLARLTDATVPPRVEEPCLAALARAGALAPRLCRRIGILIAAERVACTAAHSFAPCPVFIHAKEVNVYLAISLCFRKSVSKRVA